MWRFLTRQGSHIVGTIGSPLILSELFAFETIATDQGRGADRTGSKTSANLINGSIGSSTRTLIDRQSLALTVLIWGHVERGTKELVERQLIGDDVGEPRYANAKQTDASVNVNRIQQSRRLRENHSTDVGGAVQRVGTGDGLETRVSNFDRDGPTPEPGRSKPRGHRVAHTHEFSLQIGTGEEVDREGFFMADGLRRSMGFNGWNR